MAYQDEHAFRELTDPHRRELQVHLYRMVGSVQEAEDLLQETLLAAWRGLDRFDGRASVRAWLYRIATNRALDALRASRRRPAPSMPPMPTPTRLDEPLWLEAYPDRLLEGVPDDAPGPEARYETREAIALAFVVGLQHLPGQQRAVLVLRDVLGYRAAEVAAMLETSEASVNSLLRRARSAFAARLPATGRERAPLPGDPARARPRRALRHGGRGRRRRRDGRDADRRRLADHAAAAPRLPGPRRHRRLPARQRGPPGHRAAGAPDARQRPAGVRVLTWRAGRTRCWCSRWPVREISAITWFAGGGAFAAWGLPQTI